MKSTDIPTKFSIPFGNSAATGTIRPVPVADQTASSPGAASLTTGFPVATGQPLASGGVPPAMQDFNGILNQITAWSRWQNAGALVPFDNAFAQAIGGYPSGAVLASTTAGVIWLSVVENNNTNPDGASASGWISVASTNTPAKGSLIARRVFSTPGTQAYTPTAGTNRVRVTVVGGGGAGAGTSATSSGQFSVGGGGGGGGVAVATVSTGFAGVNITVGAGGAPVTGGASPGGNGGSSSFGSICAANGGLGGTVTNPQSTVVVQAGGAGGTATGGTEFNGVGVAGANGVASSNQNAASGNGGASYFGSGASAQFTTTANGLAATTPGAGGGGAVSLSNQSAQAGGAGAPGQIIVEEYV